MEKNNNEEFINIDFNDQYIDKKTISSLIFKANKFFDSFENFAQIINKKLDYLIECQHQIINKKLDYLIECQHQKDNGGNNRPAFLLDSKEKQPEDSKSQHNSKQPENVSSSRSSTPFYEENEKELFISKGPADSTKNRNKKKKNITRKNNQGNKNFLSSSINSQFFLYKNNINELIDDNK